MSKKSLPSSKSGNFLDKVKEVIEIREGIRGAKDNAFVTYANLKKYDPLKDAPAGPLVVKGDPPAPPDNLQVESGMLGNTLRWDESPSSDVWYYEVWVSQSQDRGSANLLATVSHPVTTYTHSLNATNVTENHYYWIRAVSWSGLYSIWEPPDAQGGYLVEGSTSYSEMTSELTQILENQITETQLYNNLNNRIDLIDGPEDMEGSVDSRIKDIKEDYNLDEIENTRKEIHNIYLEEGETVIDYIHYMHGKQDDVEGEIINIKNLDISENTALLTKFTELEGSIGDVQGNVTDILNLEIDEDKALAETLRDLRIEDDKDNSAAVTDYLNTRLDAEDNHFAQAVRQVSLEVDGETVSLEQSMEAIHKEDGLLAQYSVKVDNDGYVAGFGLSSEPVDGELVSSFIVNVDQFAIGKPDQATNHPFIVGNIDGQQTVGINGQLVVDGSIFAHSIGADQITGTHIAANSIEASHIQAGVIEVGYDEITGDKPPSDADKTTVTTIGNAMDGTAVITTGIIRDSSSNIVIDFDNANIKVNHDDGLIMDGMAIKLEHSGNHKGYMGANNVGVVLTSPGWAIVNGDTRVNIWSEGDIDIRAGQYGYITLRAGPYVQPSTDNATDLGTSSKAWRKVVSHSFIEASHVPDMRNGKRALDALANIAEWIDSSGKINHSAHYAGVELDDERTGAKGAGISLGKRCAEMEKMIYELNEEVKDLKNKLIKR